MITVQGKISRKTTLAFSGGSDSSVVLDFLSRNHEVTLLWIDYDNETSRQEEGCVEIASKTYNCPLIKKKVIEDRLKGFSDEEYWREKRYEIFHEYDSEIITAHHLNDCVETWIWSSLNGMGKLIPYRNKNVIRPFLLNNKTEFVKWRNKHDIAYFDDETNLNPNFAVRNYIRHELVDRCKKVNPGLFTMVRNKVLKEFTE